MKSSKQARHNAVTEAIADIARIHLNIQTLEEQGSDRLDFHDLSVGAIEYALRAAYEAGFRAGERE